MPDWVVQRCPKLKLRVACSQPTFTHHGTHIVGLTAASKHVAMALQPATMISFETTERNWWLLCCWWPPRGNPRGPPFAHQVVALAPMHGFQHHACS